MDASGLRSLTKGIVALEKYIRDEKYIPERGFYVYIPKDNLGLRPVCVISMIDRIVYQAMFNQKILGLNRCPLAAAGETENLRPVFGAGGALAVHRDGRRRGVHGQLLAGQERRHAELGIAG